MNKKTVKLKSINNLVLKWAIEQIARYFYLVSLSRSHFLCHCFSSVQL